MASATSSVSAGLGYPGSQTAQRTAEGIRSITPEKTVLSPLLNYPVLMRITKTAIEKIDRDWRKHGDHQSIEIRAVSKEGESLPLFTINNDFFGRIQKKRYSEQPEHTFEVGTFVYNDKENSFSSYLEENGMKETGCERSFTEWEDLRKVREIKEFKAELLTGFIVARSTHEFAVQYFDYFPELLFLSVDVDPEGKWQLLLQQKKGIPHPGEKDVLVKEKMQLVSQKAFRTSIVCPITKRIVREPVYLGGGICYEREELLKWARFKSKEPLPEHKTPFDKLLKRTRELSAKLEGQEEGEAFSLELQQKSARLEHLSLASGFLRSSDIPEGLDGKDRALWLVRFIQDIQIRSKWKPKPFFISTENAAEAKIDPITQSMAKLFRATHTIY